ncbi:hypothetical protein [Acidomonas methanolica]|uniref:Uncharacterized protein n=1 Tax=Acidomonas methanolica NBRC 104435 TaxID=1231351 RepID=A0A023D3Q2_ACIMT|nr:hypothetical protein [Acidomonas methanolica]MBU2654991.1 hypothetical protein [Acidomonas methanolica]TCS25694.1 hypothetical protein EDC31_11762 [Acidomonas methanolica]GAJ28451.1 hypothetical protein Amme_027_002 [Acidomonas methanolica NBRC 104435]GEK99505.1 hypothetical protein AME01nite_20040 [Acidomonas methanolica NBRC 104435]
MSIFRFSVPAMLAGLVLTAAPAAHAIPAKQCYADFRAAKKAGTLNGQTYKEYKAAQCGDAAAPAAASTAPATPAASPAPAAPAPAAPAAAQPVASSGNVVFPGAVAPQYAKLSPGKARMKTCLDQYHANKSTGGNGSLKWIQKGGGYYSECNAKLKG